MRLLFPWHHSTASPSSMRLHTHLRPGRRYPNVPPLAKEVDGRKFPTPSRPQKRLLMILGVTFTLPEAARCASGRLPDCRMQSKSLPEARGTLPARRRERVISFSVHCPRKIHRNKKAWIESP